MMQKRHFANIVLIKDKKLVLMQLRDDRPDISFPGKWCLPGGRIDENESAEEAVRRECEEETGYVLRSPIFLKKQVYDFIEEAHHPDIAVYYEEYDGKQKVSCNEGQRMEFVLLEELEDKRVFPMHKELALEVISKMIKEKLIS